MMSRSQLWCALLVVAVGLFPPARGAEAGKSDTVIRMPPFVVEVDAFGGLHWLYGEGHGFQILSAGEKAQTQQFIEDLVKHRAYLKQFIPAEFLPEPTLPTTLILFPRSLTDRMDKEMAQELNALPTASTAPSRFEPMNDLRLSDPDSTYIFVILKDWQWMRARVQGQRDPAIVDSPSYLRALIESRPPALPAWYAAGISGLYRSALLSERSSSFAPDPWLSEDAARILRSHPSAPRPLLPLRELFVPNPPHGKSEKYRSVWEAQAELFVRWAYSENVADGRERLRRFVAAAATEPVTQDLFRSCFGMNYADARDALSDYLPEAVRKPLRVSNPPGDSPPPIQLRDAHPEEIRRIKGEWARRTLRVIKENYPTALPLYVDKTRKLLQRAYDRGERDPQLLASLALFRMDTGDQQGGRAILAAHPEAVSARPLAGLALAQSHLLDALRQPAGPQGNLSEEQAAAIFGEAAATFDKTPPIEGAYVLAATVLQHLGRDPTQAERASLDAGARLFPRNSQLAILAASWELRAGDILRARTLIDLALWASSDPAAKEKLALLSALASQVSSAADKANLANPDGKTAGPRP